MATRLGLRALQLHTANTARAAAASRAATRWSPCRAWSPSVTQSKPRFYSATSSLRRDNPESSTSIKIGGEELPEKDHAGSTEPRLMIQFTCTVPDCGTRSSHEFSKSSYERGIVIVQCPGCKNKHLIADHLGWFKDSRTGDGKLRTIEHIMKKKGELVKRGRITNGVISFEPEQ